jgi:hypothetical protein
MTSKTNRTPRKSKDTPRKPSDVTVANGGSLWIFYPQSPAGRRWIEHNTAGESTWYGGGLVVEHRYGTDLVLGMRDDGLIVSAA